MTTAIALDTSKGDLPLVLNLGIIFVGVVFIVSAAAQLMKSAAVCQLRGLR